MFLLVRLPLKAGSVKEWSMFSFSLIRTGYFILDRFCKWRIFFFFVCLEISIDYAINYRDWLSANLQNSAFPVISWVMVRCIRSWGSRALWWPAVINTLEAEVGEAPVWGHLGCTGPCLKKAKGLWEEKRWAAGGLGVMAVTVLVSSRKHCAAGRNSSAVPGASAAKNSQHGERPG